MVRANLGSSNKRSATQTLPFLPSTLTHAEVQSQEESSEE